MLQNAGKEASPGNGTPPYTRHCPERTLLYTLIKEYYPVFEAHCAERPKINLSLFLCPFFLSLCLAFSTYAASSAKTIEILLANETPPPGVVFDIDEWDNEALRWAIPLVRSYVDRLRARFPGLDIAVVSHGDEEFALMKYAEPDFKKVQQEVEALVADQVPVHVCAGHAVMSG